MKTYTLTQDDILKIFQAGARRGYSQRSIMAGATGTNEPDFETFMKNFPDNIQEESPDDQAARLDL